MSRLIPLSDLVMVKVGEVQKYEGKIIVPDTAQEQSQWATVVAVGPAVQEKMICAESDFEPASKVIFSKYAGNEVEFEGEKYLLLHEAEVLAILQENV